MSDESDAVQEERRWAPRHARIVAARFVTEDLSISGLVIDIGPRGVFFASRIIVEPGETGRMTIENMADLDDLGVRVVWVRSSSHPEGSGMGLELLDPASQAFSELAESSAPAKTTP